MGRPLAVSHGLPMTRKIHTVKPTALKCLLVLKCCQRVMQTFMDAARSGLHCHDWHTGNIGFMDDLALHMVLIDFEGNREASPAESYTNRINNALLCFLRYLPGPHTYSQGQDFARYFADQSPEVQNNINHWKSIMTMMAETYLKWWKNWSSKAMQNELPSLDEMKQVNESCSRVSLERVEELSHVNATIASGQNALASPRACSTVSISGTISQPSCATRMQLPLSASTWHSVATTIVPASVDSAPTRPRLPNKTFMDNVQTGPASGQSHASKLSGIRI